MGIVEIEKNIREGVINVNTKGGTRTTVEKIQGGVNYTEGNIENNNVREGENMRNEIEGNI